MFEPDGWGAVLVAWGVVAGAVLTIGFLGHRFAGRTVSHVVARVAGAGGTLVAGVLATALTLNAQYGWYASWSDAWDSLTSQRVTANTRTVGEQPRAHLSAERLRQANAANTAADRRYATQRTAFERSLRLHDDPNGHWVKLTVPGIPMTGKDVGRVMVWIPGSYTTNPSATYPVIEAFHGMPGGTLDYERVFHLDGALATAKRKGEVSDAIIVVPQEMPRGIDTECVDGGGLTMETWLTSTVPDYVISHLRVQASRESWLALGVSAGAWCASMAALLHPDRYAGLVSLGGYFRPDFSAWNPFAKTGVPARYDLVKRVAEHPSDQALWVLDSSGDKLSGPSTQQFISAVRPPNSLTVVDYPGAGHRFEVWIEALPDVFTWISRAMPEFTVGHQSTTQSASRTPAPAASLAPTGVVGSARTRATPSRTSGHTSRRPPTSLMPLMRSRATSGGATR